MLKKAIQSCQTQTIKNIKIIVLDNASNDETSSIVQEIAARDDRIHLVSHETNIGMLNNYQYGLSTVKTEFFSFLSDDDLLLPCFLEVALNDFSQFPDIAFSACSTAIVSEQQEVLGVPLDLWPREGRFLPSESPSEMIDDKHFRFPVPNTVLFRTQFALKAAIDFENQPLWDCDFLMQLAGQFPIAISKQRAGIFLNHSGSFSDNQNIIKPLQRLADRVANFSWMDEPIRQLTLARINAHECRISVRTILSSLLRKKFVAAKEIARDLRNKDRTLKHGFLLVIIHIFSLFPFLSGVLVIIKKIRNVMLPMIQKRKNL
jgi:glycosyltransferase involved in cell wall biosynthesis